MFGWMAIATFAIFGHDLGKGGSPVFWFMMQVAMFFGFAELPGELDPDPARREGGSVASMFELRAHAPAREQRIAGRAVYGDSRRRGRAPDCPRANPGW